MPSQEQNPEFSQTGITPEENHKIPVIEERLVVSTGRIETGRVSVSKHVTEQETLFEGSVTREEVVIERKELNQYVDVAPQAIRQEGDVTIISVVKEVLVVEKRLMLVEELHITKRRHHDQNTFSEVLRKEEISITRQPPGTEI